MHSPQGEGLILPLNSAAATVEQVGGKGASLARMAAAALPVPPGFHLTTTAYRRFVEDNLLAEPILCAAAQAKADDPASLDRASAQIQSLMSQGTMPAAIAELIRMSYERMGADNPVAVRSSATAEDLPEMSFAGQQETYLNVRGAGPVLEAVKRCWASLWTARALGYRARQGIRSEDVALAVIVQHLIAADVAGILFTANPLTGDGDQMVINAAWGLGEAIVSGSVTPDTFIVNKRTLELESQEIASKDVMTLRLAQGTREQPVPVGQRTQAALSAPMAAELARLGAQIEQLYGIPMDIEWAMRDGRFFILQARPITGLPGPRATLDWKLPRAGRRYWRGSVTELLPDPLSPLFATLALPLWNNAIRGLVEQVGPVSMLPRQLLITINDYAYYDFNLSASQKVRALLAMPRLMVRGFGWLGRAQARWAEEARPPYAGVTAKWTARDLSATTATQLLDGAREIAGAAAEHYLTIQSGILPAAYASEIGFAAAYNHLAKRKDDPPAVVFLLGFDSAPILAEKSLYDVAMWARGESGLAAYLTRSNSTEIAVACQSASAPFAGEDAWREFCRRLGEHLDRFGHAVYDLDFEKSVPADDPTPLLEILKYFLALQVRNPYERQSAAAKARDHAMQSLMARLKGTRLRLFKWLLARAQRYAPLREDALADVGLGWPVLRRMLREAGRRLVDAGALAAPEDIFWLNADEAEAAARALDAKQTAPDYRHVVVSRCELSERERAVTPPMALPIKGGARFLGIDFSRMMPARTDQMAGDIIKGQAGSPGCVTGVARVIHGPGEFSQMRPGDILVAKITTPAWTPLFALAAGVVTDVGGPLSHSSIVAREYHVPAVMGTGVATARIQSGQRITVDGDRGVVKIGA